MGDYSLGAYASGLRDLLGVIGVERVTVVGQSLGGGVAMQLAYQHPELVERLVLVGSGGLGREVSWMLRLLTLPGAEYVMPVLFPPLARQAGDALSRLVVRTGFRAPNVDEMWQAYASLTGVGNRHAFIRTLRSVIDPGGQSVSAKDRLYLCAAMPTMIVWGDADPIIPVEHAYAATIDAINRLVMPTTIPLKAMRELLAAAGSGGVDIQMTANTTVEATGSKQMKTVESCWLFVVCRYSYSTRYYWRRRTRMPKRPMNRQ